MASRELNAGACVFLAVSGTALIVAAFVMPLDVDGERVTRFGTHFVVVLLFVALGAVAATSASRKDATDPGRKTH